MRWQSLKNVCSTDYSMGDVRIPGPPTSEDVVLKKDIDIIFMYWKN